MQIHLRTRGVPRRLDYGFLGSTPESRWWDAYSEVTATERPCLLAVAADGRRRVLISGVPSVRTDSVGTLIYYTLVIEDTLEAAGTEAGKDSPQVLSLVSRWLADVAGHPEGRGSLSELLDEVCPSAEVDRLLAAHPSELRAEREEFTARLTAALAALEQVAPAENAEAAFLSARRWVAGRSTPGADAAFLARLSSLLSGAEGQAHLLNLVSSPEDVTSLAPGPLAVLVEGGLVGDAAMPAEALPDRPSRGALTSPKARRRAALHPAALTALIIVVLALVLAGIRWIWPDRF